MSHVIDPDTYLENFQRRVLADAIASVDAQQWHKRADTFERSAPRPGDFVGRKTPEQVHESRRRAYDSANACRWRAWVFEGADVDKPPTLRCAECDTVTSPWRCSCGELRIGTAA